MATVVIMPKDAERKRWARANARFTINLQRAFLVLSTRLNHAYGQPDCSNAAELRSRHIVALLAVAHFLEQLGPEGLAHFAERFCILGQALADLDEGIRNPILDPAPVTSRRGDRTVIWAARAHAALAVETMRWCGHKSRASAAKWAAGQQPDLKKLVTEVARDPTDLVKTMVSWCESFSGDSVRNRYAACVYAVGIEKLAACAPNYNRDQLTTEADRLLQKALALTHAGADREGGGEGAAGQTE